MTIKLEDSEHFKAMLCFLDRNTWSHILSYCNKRDLGRLYFSCKTIRKHIHKQYEPMKLGFINKLNNYTVGNDLLKIIHTKFKTAFDDTIRKPVIDKGRNIETCFILYEDLVQLKTMFNCISEYSSKIPTNKKLDIENKIVSKVSGSIYIKELIDCLYNYIYDIFKYITNEYYKNKEFFYCEEFRPIIDFLSEYMKHLTYYKSYIRRINSL